MHAQFAELGGVQLESLSQYFATLLIAPTTLSFSTQRFYMGYNSCAYY